MSKESGGPAFPSSIPYGRQQFIDASTGMTLRDYFAGQALEGMLADDFNFAYDDKGPLVNLAYSIADAMLAERSKPLKRTL